MGNAKTYYRYALTTTWEDYYCSVSMSSAASRIFKHVKPHLPMIKFRKGNLITQAMPALPETVLAPAVATPMAPAASSKKWQSDQINLEWWQTPLKYKRRDVDTLEVDSINSGGADKLYQ